MSSFGTRVGAAAVILWMAAGFSACGEKKQAAVARPVVRDVEVVVVRPVPTMPVMKML